MKSGTIAALMLSVALSATVWALSVPLTGSAEPWDAESPYYLLALATAGAISGAIAPRPVWAHYAGAVLGQAGYELAFLPIGPLFLLGLAYLAGFSIIFAVAAALAGLLRKSPPPGGAAG